MNLQKGQRISLGQLGLQTKSLIIEIYFDIPLNLDFSCFCLNEHTQLVNDDDFIFYNQLKHLSGGVELILPTINQAIFRLNLDQIQPQQKLVLCATAEQGTIGQLRTAQLLIKTTDGQQLVNFDIEAGTFLQEKAVMLAEFYFKDTWRIATVAQGFNAGLPALIQHFGGDVQPAENNKIDLKKKLILEKIQQHKPELINLTKQSMIVLEKKNLLNIEANVALVLDVTGSMNHQYKNGDVQKILDRLLPLAMNFDHNQSFECWAFAEKPTQLSNVSLSNIYNFVETDHRGWRLWDCGARWNNEPTAIRHVLNFYQNSQTSLPTYVLFISDGGVIKNREIQAIIREASAYPIFWQFVGVGGHNYGALEKLDDLKNRVVDNCDFFAIDHIQQLSETEIYNYLLEEFPDWLKEIQKHHIKW